MVWEKVCDDGLLILSRKLNGTEVKVILNAGDTPKQVTTNQSVVLSNLVTENNHELTVDPKGFALVK